MRCEDEKLERLRSILGHMGSVAVAFSGGVDSTFLLKVASDVLPGSAVAITAVGAGFSSEELGTAAQQARELGVPLRTVRSREMEDERFLANGPDRCYWCKMAVFKAIIEEARNMGLDAVIDGENSDDLMLRRPGRRAREELGVRSPLAEAGLGKEEIRALSARLGLSTAFKPQMACLATRIPYGERITSERLRTIGAAESFLRSLGLGQLRVRHHGAIARIEVPPSDFRTVLEKRAAISARLRDLGFTYITLDIMGFRSGSMDEVLARESSR